MNHSKKRVRYDEIWNEPNLQVFFEGTPADYNTRILIPGADALHDPGSNANTWCLAPLALLAIRRKQ